MENPLKECMDECLMCSDACKAQKEIISIEKKHELFITEVKKRRQEIVRHASKLRCAIDKAANQLLLKLARKKRIALKLTCDRKSELMSSIQAWQIFTGHTRGLLDEGNPSDIANAYHKRATELLKVETKSRFDCFCLPEIGVSVNDLFGSVINSINSSSSSEMNALSEQGVLTPTDSGSPDDITASSGLAPSGLKTKKRKLAGEIETKIYKKKKLSGQTTEPMTENLLDMVKKEIGTGNENQELPLPFDELVLPSTSLNSIVLTPAPVMPVSRVNQVAKLALATTRQLKLIHSLDESGPISCVAILGKELYSICDEACIKVYDVESKAFSTPKRRIQVPGLSGVFNMEACNRYRCIYLSDYVNHVVHRVDNEEAIIQWPVSDIPCGLSVNSVFNVLVTCHVGKVKEFTSYGELIRVVQLNSSIVNPIHAVELNTQRLVVTHGTIDPALCRVCIVDLSGRLVSSYGCKKGERCQPLSVIVSGQVILIADLYHHSVMMFNHTLKFIRNVVVNLKYPLSMCLNSDDLTLYVADNKWKRKRCVGSTINVYYGVS